MYDLNFAINLTELKKDCFILKLAKLLVILVITGW